MEGARQFTLDAQVRRLHSPKASLYDLTRFHDHFNPLTDELESPRLALSGQQAVCGRVWCVCVHVCYPPDRTGEAP